MSDTGTIIVVVLFWVSLGLVIYPFVQSSRAEIDNEQTRADHRRTQQRDRLQALYEQCVASLRDLDEDHALGRMEESHYRTEREKWARRGVQALQVIRSLDAGIAPSIQPATNDETEEPGELDQAVEQAITGYAESV